MDEEEGLKGEVDAAFHNSFLSRRSATADRIINHLCMYPIPPSLLPSFKWLLFNLSQLWGTDGRTADPGWPRLKGAICGTDETKLGKHRQGGLVLFF